MAGGIITTGNTPKALWPGVYAWFGDRYNQHVTEYTDLYEINDSKQAYEEIVQKTGFYLAAVKAQGANITYDSDQQGPVTRAQHIAYALGYAVTKEELDDNLYESISMRRSKNLANAMQQTVERIGAGLYNNAFSTTFFTTADGAALVSTAHVNTTGGTYSNALSPAADLAESSLEDLSIQIMQTLDDRGLNIAIMPRTLHIAVNDWYNANRVLKSVLQSNTSNNNINVLNSTNAFPGGIKMNHYFTSAHAFFIRTNVEEGMVMFWRNRPEFQMDNDFNSKNLLHSAYMRFSVTCADPRGIFGSNGP